MKIEPMLKEKEKAVGKKKKKGTKSKKNQPKKQVLLI